MKSIQLLDCTLRDGGHLTGGYFKKNVIQSVTKALIDSNTDIVEVGFYMNEPYGEDYARFNSIKNIKKILPPSLKKTKISVMADFVDVNDVEPYDGTVEYFRLSFKRHRLEWALNAAEILMKKGYKCYINPVNINVYSDEELLKMIAKINKLNPFSMSIVDTFGVLRKRDVLRLYHLIDHNLNPEIGIGLHLHENLGLAFSLATAIIETRNPNRQLTIDGSLLGMGRVPGNLCIEQMMDHMNCEYGAGYELEYAYDAIDDYIAPIKEKVGWGYMLPYALSAKFHLHRTYAEFLLKKGNLRTKDIQRILCNVSPEKSELFDEEYVETLYRTYMDVKYDHERYLTELKKQLKHKTILIICPGRSIKTYNKEILDYSTKSNIVTISVNFVPDFLNPDYIFCSNIKRYESEKLDRYAEKLITTSNIRLSEKESKFIFEYNDLSHFDDIYCDDTTLKLLNLLKKINIENVTLAGFDGFKNNIVNYYDPSLSRSGRFVDRSSLIKNILSTKLIGLNIQFLTPSSYME